MEEALAKLKRIEKAVLFFSSRSESIYSERGMIALLRYWATQQQDGLKNYLNGLADALEGGGSNANRS